MGSLDKYCPRCGSEEIWKIELGEGADKQTWYECGDCHSEWQSHSSRVTTEVGTHE